MFLKRGIVDRHSEKDGFVYISKGRHGNGEQQMSLSRAGNRCWGYAIVLYQLNPAKQARATRGPQLVMAMSRACT